MRTLLFGWLCIVGCTDGGGGGKESGSTTTLPAGACREGADCGSGELCFSPSEANCPVYQSCLGYTCPTGQVCLPADPAVEPCADSVCRDSCTEDAGCRAGAETCDVTTGQCVPIPCDAGYPCGSFETCQPGGPLHGCVRDDCLADSDCGTGRCVEGHCYDDFGFCSYAAEN